MNKFFPKPKGENHAYLSFKEFPKTQFFPKEKSHFFILVVALFFSFLPQKGRAQCTGSFACNGSLNITVDENCRANLNPSQFFANYSSQPANCQESLHLYVTNENGDFIAQGDSVVIDFSNFNPFIAIGDSIMVTVFQDNDNDNIFDSNEPNCWGKGFIEDKSAPVIAECRDTSIYCYENLASTIGGPIFPIKVTDNCNNTNNVSITLADSTLMLVDCATNPNVKALLQKKWVVEDTFGNKDSCTQMITILRLPVAGISIAAPTQAVLECNATNPPDTSVATLGYPKYTFNNGTTDVTIELTPANTSGLCSDIKVIYSDSPNLGGLCTGEEKYIRTFKILDCCTNSFLDGNTVKQFISIMDNAAPVLTCPSSMTVGTTSNSCGANVFLPAVGIADACTNSGFNISVATPSGTLATNGGIITNVPVGEHTIIYSVEDACGNADTCQMMLTVVDNIVPIAVCDEHTVVALNNLGQATVAAITFDDGSTDNCGIVTYEVRRMVSNCSAATPFSSHVEFACCDIGDTIMVEMKVTDAAGNFNSCMVEVTIQDKIAPTLICPNNKTIECGSDTSALVLGTPVAFDNCGTATVTHFNIGSLDPMCGTGTLTRVWRATDEQGATVSCLQTISVINSTPFSGNTDPNDLDDIIFPADLMGANAISCTAFQNDSTLINPTNTGEPQIIGAISGCSMIGNTISSELNFDVGSGGCGSQKIFRKWAVVDWCQAPNPPDLTQNGVGVWVHTQIIMVTDSQDPVLTNAIGDLSFVADANCEAIVMLPSVPGDIEDCSDDISVSVTHNLTASGGVGFGPFTVGAGIYQATYLLDDGCGNTTTHNISVEVDGSGTPNFSCVPSFAVPLMYVFPNMGTLTLQAADLVDISSAGSCGNSGTLNFTVVHDSLNTNTPPTSPSITFDCSDLGTNNIVIWGCDNNGNCNSCSLEIDIQKTGVTCGIDNQPDVAGIIDNESGDGIDQVEVNINNGQYMEMTDVNGYFNVDSLPINNSLSIQPNKNDDPRNGVSTYDIVLINKHILGIELLDSPYKVIAGDVNGSGGLTALDMVQIRNLILMNVNEFPNGMPSWRFIDADFTFSDPINPFADPFPESVNVQNLTTDLMDVDFVAVKLGDVTGNATPNLLANETRNTNGSLIFKTKTQQVKKGEVVSLVFETENNFDWAAWQFSLSYETSELEFLEVKKMEHIHFGTSAVENGAITFSWSENVNVLLEDKLKWFEVQWIAKENVNLEEAIKINSTYTPAIAYDANGNEYDVQLHFENTN